MPINNEVRQTMDFLLKEVEINNDSKTLIEIPLLNDEIKVIPSHESIISVSFIVLDDKQTNPTINKEKCTYSSTSYNNTCCCFNIPCCDFNMIACQNCTCCDGNCCQNCLNSCSNINCDFICDIIFNIFSCPFYIVGGLILCFCPCIPGLLNGDI
jgi:hypothetical protein